MEVEPKNLRTLKYRDYTYIETHNTKICPFCKSDTVFYSSSWSNEECLLCGATYIIDGWWKDA